ncbi:hypothetical protein A2765_05840 [Candidatus Kaiserbacteria bacterium RIFCSPHIGHO2_01_FULL_56_24]|uniref:Methyltransferase domain-containing protein n=1 Tax=Candidatus Kaiserbacteria bacterium RIFCSPHIGHO2_01_FULL_56_24 TaxID=1798487 RepID=A0A1F6DAR5_9BACT|nr:MAG: hypothetical protein A2765_05840 [Candidatus Kaiserbacteria bacterium RIFCSPHIGHO2_01_FULL_56_24]
MREYYGTSAKKYGQTRGKQLLLLPALSRHLPKARNKKIRALDVACGNGDVFPLIKEKGYKYFGIDISADLLARAIADYPAGEYRKGDARSFARHYKARFDAIIISMLFPSLKKAGDIIKVLKECKTVIEKDGVILMAITHPSFDHYMQSFLFRRDDVHANFKGYFHSGSRFEMDQTINGEAFRFEDYHWTLADYMRAIQKSGLQLVAVDECQGVSSKIDKEDRAWARKRDSFPTYLVLVLKR